MTVENGEARATAASASCTEPSVGWVVGSRHLATDPPGDTGLTLSSSRRISIGGLASNRCRRMSLRTRKWEAMVQMLVREAIWRRTSKGRKTAAHHRGRRHRAAACLARSPATRDGLNRGLRWRVGRGRQSRRRVLEVGVGVSLMKAVMLSSVLMKARRLSGGAVAGGSAVGAEPVVTAVESLRLGAELFIIVSLVESSKGGVACGRPGSR